MWVTKLLISPVKKKGFFAQKRPNLAQNWHFGQFGPGHEGLFSDLLVGRLVVVARGLYLARPLFTLLQQKTTALYSSWRPCPIILTEAVALVKE